MYAKRNDLQIPVASPSVMHQEAERLKPPQKNTKTSAYVEENSPKASKEQQGKSLVKGSLGGETSVLRTFRMSGKELVKERVSEGKS